MSSYMGTITDYGCIGGRLGHSFSGDIHAEIGRRLCERGLIDAPYDYRLQELREDEIEAFFARRAFRGINVTIPYKQTVIPFLDELTEAAQVIGAVNTVVNRDGRLIGDNTDFYGMKTLLEQNGIEVRGKKVLILGTGGTSKTALAVAQSLGASEALRVSRRPQGEGEIAYSELGGHTDAGVILNTTPVGMYPDDESCSWPASLDLARFEGLCGVADAVYHPLRTELVLAARRAGARAVGGLGMLVAQAVAAAERFLGVRAPEALVGEIERVLTQRKQSVVLVGMPGCGKTTVGALLSERTGKALLDTDEEIKKTTGRSAEQHIKEKGESAFREVEAAVIRDCVAPLDGVIVATGGGAVLRDDTVRRLRRNGVLIFLDRPLESLIATPDRPLSSDAESLRRRYEERHGRYEAVCDVKIEVAPGERPERTAERVLQALNE